MPSFGLDTSFGLGGIDVNPVGSQVKFDHIASMTQLPNGTLLAAGNLASSGGVAGAIGDVALVRLTSAGAADKTFGGGTGLDILSTTQTHNVSAMVVLPDGKILLGGSDQNTVVNNTTLSKFYTSKFFVMRFNADGSLDTTFGTGGEAKSDFGGYDRIASLAVQADGKIVAAGSTQATGSATNPLPNINLAVARLNANGTLDNTFGVGGEMVLSPGDGVWTTAGLAIQPDGKLVVGVHLTPSVSSQQSGGLTELRVYRFNADGTPDSSFGTAGRAQTHYSTFTYVYATSMALLKDGTIVLGGGSSYGQGLLAWFKGDGSLIKAEQFGATSAASITATGPHWIKSIAPSPQGGVEVLGNSYDTSDFLLEYHAAPGSATNSKELTFTSGYGGVEVIAMQMDGKVVVAGIGSAGDGLWPNNFGGMDSPHLGVIRFSDQGQAESSATIMKVLASRRSYNDGMVDLEVHVMPVLGPAVVESAVITFREGTTVLGTATQGTNSFFQPSSSITIALAEGDHTIMAEYAGSAQWAASSFTFHLHVENPKVTVALTVSNSTPFPGDPITLKATVQETEDGKSVYTGMVAVNFYDGDSILRTVMVVDGAATLSTYLLADGIHNLRAGYNNSTTDATATVTVQSAPLGIPSVDLLVQPTPGSASSATLTAKVQPPANLTGVRLGNVTFFDGSTVLGSAVLGSNGVALLSTTILQPGTHLFRVNYEGNAVISATTSTVKRYTVVANLTATTLIVPTGPVPVGQPVVLKANVNALSAGFPIGTVAFMQGSNLLGTAAVDDHGNATLTLNTFVGAGAHSITAVYSGCSTCLASSSSAALVTITSSASKTITQTTLTVPIAAPVFGQTERLSVQVAAAAGALVPSGLVAFYDGDKLLGTVALNASGKATLDVQLNLGLRRFKAIYLGNAVQASSASAVISQAVTKAATSVVASGSSASTSSAKTVTLTAAVYAQAAGSPIGTVTFREGSTVLGSGAVNGKGIATFKTSTLPAGKHFITAFYSGSSTFLGSTSMLFEVDVV